MNRCVIALLIIPSLSLARKVDRVQQGRFEAAPEPRLQGPPVSRSRKSNLGDVAPVIQNGGVSFNSGRSRGRAADVGLDANGKTRVSPQTYPKGPQPGQRTNRGNGGGPTRGYIGGGGGGFGGRGGFGGGAGGPGSPSGIRFFPDEATLQATWQPWKPISATPNPFNEVYYKYWTEEHDKRPPASPDHCSQLHIEYAESVDPRKYVYNTGEGVKIRCRSQYYIQGGSSSTCRKGGFWDPIPECIYKGKGFVFSHLRRPGTPGGPSSGRGGSRRPGYTSPVAPNPSPSPDRYTSGGQITTGQIGYPAGSINVPEPVGGGGYVKRDPDVAEDVFDLDQ